MDKPYLIDCKKIGDAGAGFLSVAEKGKELPFEIKRLYWLYEAPANALRGNHAHIDSLQILIALHGIVTVELEDTDGDIEVYILDDPSKGLFIPRMYWRRIQMGENAVCLCLSSAEYDATDYIKDYEIFRLHSGS
jgi:hypothetical protein